MIHPAGPGSGISPLSASWSMLGAMRTAQAELRATQKTDGHTTLGDNGTLTARAVAEVQAKQAARGPELRPGDSDGSVDPALTGPRPTFTKTPLEKMRTDALQGLVDRVGATPGTGDSQEAAPGSPGDGDGRLSPQSPKAAYEGLREIDAARDGGRASLDMTT